MSDSTDRYLIDPLNGPAQMAEEFRSIWEAIRALQGAPLSGANLVALDGPGGDEMVRVGLLDDDEYGLEVRSEVGNWDLARLTSDGWYAPHLQGAPYDPATSKAITSGTLVDTYAVLFGDALGPGVETQISWVTDPGTTGELQVRSNGGTNTTTHSLAAGSSGVTYVRWLHGFTVGSGPLILIAQARRTAGAGNVTIFPAQAWIQHPAVCSSGGTWL